MNDKTVWLIEDNEDDVELTLLAFKKNSFNNTFVILRDGTEAIEYFSKSAKRDQIKDSNLPSLILLDLNLPKVNGLEVLKSLRSNESTKFTPVIVLSTSKDKRDIIKSYINGANSYIIKPVDFSEFFRICEILRKLLVILK